MFKPVESGGRQALIQQAAKARCRQKITPEGADDDDIERHRQEQYRAERTSPAQRKTDQGGERKTDEIFPQYDKRGKDQGVPECAMKAKITDHLAVVRQPHPATDDDAIELVEAEPEAIADR